MVSGLMISENYLTESASLINRVLDVPFIMTGLLYGLTSLRLNLARDEKKHTILDAGLIALGVIIILVIIGTNLFIPDL